MTVLIEPHASGLLGGSAKEGSAEMAHSRPSASHRKVPWGRRLSLLPEGTGCMGARVLPMEKPVLSLTQAWGLMIWLPDEPASCRRKANAKSPVCGLGNGPRPRPLMNGHGPSLCGSDSFLFSVSLAGCLLDEGLCRPSETCVNGECAVWAYLISPTKATPRTGSPC